MTNERGDSEKPKIGFVNGLFMDRGGLGFCFILRKFLVGDNAMIQTREWDTDPERANNNTVISNGNRGWLIADWNFARCKFLGCF